MILVALIMTLPYEELNPVADIIVTGNKKYSIDCPETADQIGVRSVTLRGLNFENPHK